MSTAFARFRRVFGAFRSKIFKAGTPFFTVSLPFSNRFRFYLKLEFKVYGFLTTEKPSVSSASITPSQHTDTVGES